MAVKTLANLRSQIRREVRDESAGSYVFTDSELLTYINNAIRAYSKVIAREVATTLALLANTYEYDVPSGCRQIDLIRVGTTDYTVIDVYAGKFTVDPTPTDAATATFRYKAIHTLLSADSDSSTYDEADEPLIVKHVRAQCWETLAGDGARYYEYTEGDVRESQGKTQGQFRTEADKLYSEFDAGLAQSADDKLDQLKPASVTPTLAGVITRKAAETSTTIYRSS